MLTLTIDDKEYRLTEGLAKQLQAKLNEFYPPQISVIAYDMKCNTRYKFTPSGRTIAAPSR